MLIKAGSDVDKATTDYGETPVCRASTQGHVEIVDLLIKANCDVDKRTAYGRTPLSEALSHSSVTIANLLIDAAVGVDIGWDGRSTILHHGKLLITLIKCNMLFY